jgi:transposase-like protein
MTRETLIKVENQFGWLWIAIGPKDKILLLGIRISYQRNILIAEHCLRSLVRKYGKHHRESMESIIEIVYLSL